MRKKRANINKDNIYFIEIESCNKKSKICENIMLYKNRICYGTKKENDKYYEGVWYFHSSKFNIIVDDNLLNNIRSLYDLAPNDSFNQDYQFKMTIELKNKKRIIFERKGTLIDNKLDTICNLIISKLPSEKEIPLVFGN